MGLGVSEAVLQMIADLQMRVTALESGNTKGDDRLSDPITVLKLSSRAYNALALCALRGRMTKVETIGQLVEMSAPSLLAIPNLGVSTLVNIEFRLREFGLSLAPR